MPTGYTADLANLNKEEQSFQEFAMTCARAFGACISMRDDPLDKEIPDSFSEDNYHAKRLKESEELLEELINYSPQEIAEYNQKRYREKYEIYQNILDEYKKVNDRINRMLAKVNNWQPPTSDHHEYKKFMIDQLTMSLENTDYCEKELRKLEKNKNKFYEEDIESAKWAIDYHKKYQEQDANKVQANNQWIKQLRDSLKDYK